MISELVNDDGTVTKGQQVTDFATKYKLARLTIADLIAYRQARGKLVERVNTFPVETPSARSRATPSPRPSMRCSISRSSMAISAMAAPC